MSNKSIIHVASIFVFTFFACSEKKTNVNTASAFVLSDVMLSTTETAVATTIPLKNELSFFGKITADNNKLIEIYPVVGGSVMKVNVGLGDYVNKGEVLASIRSTEIASFEKDLIDAKNDVLVAKNSVKVSQELFDGKLNSERDVLEAKSDLEKAESQLHRINEIYSIYNIKKGAFYNVLAPISGFIIQKNINQDMLLRSDRSDNIFDIAQIDEVWAIANVNETDINLVKLGEEASVTTLSYPDNVFKGKVDKIFNIIDPDTKAMKVQIRLANLDFRLKPEMRANIKLSFNEDKNMIAIPAGAIIFDKNKNFVMIFKDRNNIETRQVEVYRQIGDTSYISSGISKGEKVMTTNGLLVYNALNN